MVLVIRYEKDFGGDSMKDKPSAALKGLVGSYEGETVNGLAHGHGVSRLSNGCEYVGEFAFGRPQGQGVLHFKSGGYYEGAFYVGVFSGHGKIALPDGNEIEGLFQRSKPNGRCREKMSDGGVFEGYFVDGQRCGSGLYTQPDGYRMEGIWENGEPHGFCKEKYPDGTTFEGNFVQGARCGDGEYRWAKGDVYKGQYSKGKQKAPVCLPIPMVAAMRVNSETINSTAMVFSHGMTIPLAGADGSLERLLALPAEPGPAEKPGGVLFSGGIIPLAPTATPMATAVSVSGNGIRASSISTCGMAWSIIVTEMLCVIL